MRELGCQMSHCHLLFDHRSQPHICSSNILNSQQAPEYNHWLSSMAYGSDVYDRRLYDNCLSSQFFPYDRSCPRTFQQGIASRSRYQDVEEDGWPPGYVVPAPGCRAASRDRNIIPNDMCHATTSTMTNNTFLRGLQEICGPSYKETVPSERSFNQQISTTRGNKAWTSKIRHFEFRSEYMMDEAFEHDYMDVDEVNHNSDYSIISTLCGLEEVLSRLI